MPPVLSSPVDHNDRDRFYRRAIWIAWAVILLTAAAFHLPKAADGKSAFIRWQPQVLRFWQGRNIYDKEMFPNPPIMPITLYPLMVMPPVVGAMTWFALKALMATAGAVLCFRMVREPGRPLAPAVIGLTLLLSLRPILSDLHHGNNNLLIMVLVVSALYAWRKSYDVLAGVLLALAISYKVTPALFLPYFVYKRSWRTVVATLLGIGGFLVIVPGLVLGPAFNGECLGTWFHRILSPYLVENVISEQEVNQSMVGVLTRLLTKCQVGDGRYYVHLPRLNLLDLDPGFVSLLVKGLSLVLVGLLAVFCRTKAARRDDPGYLGEFALVVLTMLFVSERSWKHHYVTVLLPYTYLTYRALLPTLPRARRRLLAAALVLSALLMATTSSELGGLFAAHQGHKIAQGYGMFLWAGVVLYAATAWRVVTERRRAPEEASGPRAPHFATPAVRAGEGTTSRQS